jgi:RNA polymerase sigma-70 factor (ECF subfamily)
VSEEQELVRRCLAGDSTATLALVQAFQHDVFGLCFRVLRHRQDAEDTTQEVFGRVFHSLHRWDGVRPLRPWILRIALNRCRTNLHKRKRTPEPVEHLGHLPDRELARDDQELREAIETGLAELRPEYKEVFVLFHELGTSYDDIAVVLRRPVGTIKTWLHRARSHLAALLQRRGIIAPEPTGTPEPRA